MGASDVKALTSCQVAPLSVDTAMLPRSVAHQSLRAAQNFVEVAGSWMMSVVPPVTSWVPDFTVAASIAALRLQVDPPSCET